MKDFRVAAEAHGPVELIRLVGSLDMFSFPRLEAQLNELFQRGRYFLVLDCQELEYIGSAGLGALIGFARQAREHAGDLRLLNVPDRIYNIIELLGFTKVLRVLQSEEDAVASFVAK
ncbi:MAG TPA: STAS domain-containing protein [Verrucomicrobiae bacterium]|nr:STAS domain-containing protein [Verrucomicrobiae bacterium]